MTPRPSSLRTLDDVALVVLLAAGQEDALGELYDRYGGLLFAVGHRILDDRVETEDLLHDVLVEAWRRARDFDPARGGVRAWLVTRMRSRALDRRKSPGRTRARALDAVADRPSQAPEPDGGDHQKLRAALRTLSPEQRAVLECAYFDGLSSSDMATHLGIPMGTVKSRMAAGLAKLRFVMGAP